MRMYIDRKGWDIPEITVNVNMYQETKANGGPYYENFGRKVQVLAVSMESFPGRVFNFTMDEYPT